ncbi:MAG: hypothetical protein ACTSYG_07355 [Candidatus Heimdallarchaeota archaeon]
MSLNYFCQKTGIPFGYVDKNGFYHETWALTKYEKKWLKALFSFLNKDTDARLLVDLYNQYKNYDIDFFWDNKNMLFTLDKENFYLGDNDSLNIVITGLGGAKGFGKSWSALALNIRWSRKDEKGRFLFSPSQIFMTETDLENFTDFRNNMRYQLDDPDLSTTGSGVEFLKQRLSKFSRKASRHSGISIIICSAVDLWHGTSAAKLKDLDGIDYYIEMWGYNQKLEHALGLVFTRTLTPLGWIMIPAPSRDLIKIYHPEKETLLEEKVLLYDYLQEKEFTPAELIDIYENDLKVATVNAEIYQEFENIIDSKVQKILDDPLLPEYAKSETTLRRLIRKRNPQFTKTMVEDLAFEVKLQLEKIAFKYEKADVEEEIKSDNFLFSKESSERLTTDYIEKMFSEEARESLEAISNDPKFLNCIEKTWKVLETLYVDNLSYREAADVLGISIATISDYHSEAREMYVGYLDEFAYARIHPELTWQGGNDNSGQADFVDRKNMLVVSKKFRFDRYWKPTAKDLSREERELILQGWEARLVVTEMQRRKLLSYLVRAATPENSSQPHSPAAGSSPGSSNVCSSSSVVGLRAGRQERQKEGKEKEKAGSRKAGSKRKEKSGVVKEVASTIKE